MVIELKIYRNYIRRMADKIYKEEEMLERKFGRDDHRHVPDGYFEAMINEVMAKLPEQEQEQRYVRMTRWEKLKPYVYLAAMFAGIWLMMNIFGRTIQNESVSLDNPPEAIAMAMTSLPGHDSYIPYEFASEIQVMDDVSEEFTNMQDFQAAFREAGAELKEEEEQDSDYMIL